MTKTYYYVATNPNATIPMIELFGVKLSVEALAFLAAFVLDEVIRSSRLKENSVLQLLSSVLNNIRPMRKEDEQVDAIRVRVDELLEELVSLKEVLQREQPE